MCSENEAAFGASSSKSHSALSNLLINHQTAIARWLFPLFGEKFA